MLRAIVANRQRLTLFITLAIVFVCGLHLACSYGLSSHETACETWNFDRLSWPSESNGMLSNFLYELLWSSNSLPYRWFWSHFDMSPAVSYLHTRFPALLLAQVVIILTVRLGNALAAKANSRPNWGLMGALILGANAAFLALSFHRRFYMLNMVMVLLATLALFRLCKERNWRWLAIYQLSLWGCCASMILSTLLVVPHLVYFVFTGTERRIALRQGALILLLSLGFLGLLVSQDSSGYGRFDYGNTHETLPMFLCNGDMGPRYAHPHFAEFHKNWDDYHCWGKPRQALVGLTLLATLLLAWQLVREGDSGKFLTGSQGNRLAVGWEQQLSSYREERAARWFCPLTVLWAVLFYETFSATIKDIGIAPNFSWVLPFWGIALGQVLCRWRYFRYIFLLALLNAVPYTHTSVLVNGTSEADNLRTLVAYRQNNEPVFFPLYTLELQHYRSLVGLGKDDTIQAHPYDVLRKVREPALPLTVEPSKLIACLQRLQSCSRSHPLRLWLHSYDQAPTAENLRVWLNQLYSQGQLEYLTTVDYLSPMYMVTLPPGVKGRAVTRHPAPTPLRGHSALKYLQRCR